MPEYYVEWSINVVADSPREAAEAAQRIQQDPDSTATVFDAFDVYEDGDEYHRIDLQPEEE